MIVITCFVIIQLDVIYSRIVLIVQYSWQSHSLDRLSYDFIKLFAKYKTLCFTFCKSKMLNSTFYIRDRVLGDSVRISQKKKFVHLLEWPKMSAYFKKMKKSNTLIFCHQTRLSNDILFWNNKHILLSYDKYR